VLLTGEVPTEALKAEAERVTRAVENVRNVFNELKVGPNTSIQTRTNDSVITSKVKARFVDANKFGALHVKVVTEDSVVYLLGMVKKQEAADATEITRTTGGVSKVVRLFEYLD
jgi:osmotically-inducible protein OsmY